MARNKVQFQKGLSEAAFREAYGSEERCHEALVNWRWPNGFECPDCGGKPYCVVMRGARKLFQCNACRKQTSVRAGTIFAASKLPLRQWFCAMYHLTQSKQGISSLELSRRLGITQNAAWKMKHKLAQVMLECNATKRLEGKIQMDDAYLGGERPGRKGRGAEGKTPFVAAVETTEGDKPQMGGYHGDQSYERLFAFRVHRATELRRLSARRHRRRRLQTGRRQESHPVRSGRRAGRFYQRANRDCRKCRGIGRGQVRRRGPFACPPAHEGAEFARRPGFRRLLQGYGDRAARRDAQGDAHLASGGRGRPARRLP